MDDQTPIPFCEDKHKLKLNGLTVDQKSYIFICLVCRAQAIVFKPHFLATLTNRLRIDPLNYTFWFRGVKLTR